MSQPSLPPDAEKMLDELRSPLGEGETGVWDQPLSEAYQATRRTVVAEAAGEWRRRPKPGIQRIRYTHEDCIDRIISSPGIREDELARIYGVTKAWMTIVINSDVFKMRLAERREELIDPLLLATLKERYGALAARSVDVLLEKLSKPADQVSDKLALEAAALGAKAYGMGEGEGSGKGDAVDHLAALAHRLIDLNKPQTPPPLAERVD